MRSLCPFWEDPAHSAHSSEKIARRIEELFPDPRLTVNQDSTLYKAVDADINELFSALLGLVWYKVAFQHIPDQAGKDYYITSREEKTGKKFADFPAQFEPGALSL